MADSFLQNKLDHIEGIARKTVDTFGKMTPAQLNYKPAPKSWSIAQCLEHLIITDKVYEPVLKKMLAGTHKPGFFAKRGIGADFFGNFLLQATAAYPDKKAKTIGIFKPSKSDISPDIIQKYRTHDRAWRELLKQFNGFDYENTYLSSPANALITLRLRDLLKLLANHKERHYHQAVAVTKTANFPTP